MDYQIRKYPLFLNGNTKSTISIPFSPLILSIQYQNDAICLWAAVDPDKRDAEMVLELYGTGDYIDLNGKIHLATLQRDEFVFHIFEVLHR